MVSVGMKNLLATEAQRHGESLKHDALYSVLQDWNIEVDQQADLFPGQPQVAENLGLKDGVQSIDRLQLDNDLVFYQEIEPMLSEALTLVNDRYRKLGENLEPP
jgi:hypothetical protein